MLKEVVRKWVDSTHHAQYYRLLRDYRRSLSSPEKVAGKDFSMIGSRAMIDGSFEPEETMFLSGILSHYSEVINIGANFGYYSLISASKGIPVWAFEPHPSNFRILLKNIEANRYEDKVRAFNCAIGKKSRVMKIWGSETGASLIKGWSTAAKYHYDLCSVNSLDHFRFSKGSRKLIILDAEGSELEIIESSQGFLRCEEVDMFCEVTVSQHIDNRENALKTHSIMKSLGYKSYWLDVSNGSLVYFDDISSYFDAVVTKTASSNLFFTRGHHYESA